jgi:hypothetical protein
MTEPRKGGPPLGRRRIGEIGVPGTEGGKRLNRPGDSIRSICYTSQNPTRQPNGALDSPEFSARQTRRFLPMTERLTQHAHFASASCAGCMADWRKPVRDERCRS